MYYSLLDMLLFFTVGHVFIVYCTYISYVSVAASLVFLIFMFFVVFIGDLPTIRLTTFDVCSISFSHSYAILVKRERTFEMPLLPRLG
jgi:hypothetical protein